MSIVGILFRLARFSADAKAMASGKLSRLLVIAPLVLFALALGACEDTTEDADVEPTVTVELEPTDTPPPPTEAPTLESTDTPVPPTATPPPLTNRRNCGTIRGTEYLSPQERQWFLDNCITPEPQPPLQQPPAQ